MRFLLSCPLAGRISGGFKKYYRLEVQLAYLVNFAQLLLRLCTVCFTFYFFCTPNQLYTPLSHFFQEYVSIYFFIWPCTPSWQDLEAQKMLPTRDTACIFSRLCPIFITVCSTIYFPALQIVVLHSLESFYFKNSFHFFFIGS